MFIEKYKKIVENTIHKYNAFSNLTLEINNDINFYVRTISQIQKNIFNEINKTDDSIQITNKSQILNELHNLSIFSLIMLQELTKEKVVHIIHKNKELFINKNEDYGNSFEDFKLIGIIVRLNDKINRIKSIYKLKQPKVDEKIEETINDLYNYCIIGLMYK